MVVAVDGVVDMEFDELKKGGNFVGCGTSAATRRLMAIGRSGQFDFAYLVSTNYSQY